MDFESILEEILLDRGQGNLKLKPKQKEALQGIVFERCNCRITKTNAQASSINECYFLHTIS